MRIIIPEEELKLHSFGEQLEYVVSIIFLIVGLLSSMAALGSVVEDDISFFGRFLPFVIAIAFFKFSHMLYGRRRQRHKRNYEEAQREFCTRKMEIDQENQRIEDAKYTVGRLFIVFNSGKTFPFPSRDLQKLKRTRYYILEAIEKRLTQSVIMIIDSFNDNIFAGRDVNQGDHSSDDQYHWRNYE